MEDKKLNKKKKILRSLLVISILAVILVLAYFILKWTGAWEYINSVEKIRQLILSLGFWGRFAFVMIQFLQVTFLPIPAAATTIAGTLVFGPWITLLISFVAVMLDSLFSFWLGRKLGKKIVIWIAGENDYNKWANKLGKGKYVFFLMMLFPVFPDDILCLIAGTTNITWKFFIITNLITRPIGIFCTCFLSSGIIPFSGWWILPWGFLAIICIFLFILSYKFQPQIENFINKLSKKLEKKNSNNLLDNDN